HHEPGKRAQYFDGVVRLGAASALGVRDGDDAVERWMHASERLKPVGEQTSETGGARRGAQNDDKIACASATPSGTAKPGKGAGRLRSLKGRSGLERFFLKLEGWKEIRKIRLRGKSGTFELPNRKGVEHGLIAHVVARSDIDERDAEGKTP